MIASFEFRNIDGMGKGCVSPEPLICGSGEVSNGPNKCVPSTTRSFQNTIKGEKFLPNFVVFLLQSSFLSSVIFLFSGILLFLFFTIQVRCCQPSSFFMSFSRDDYACSNDGRMLSLEVCLIGESSNDDPSHLHNNFNAASDQDSNIHVGDPTTSGSP